MWSWHPVPVRLLTDRRVIEIGLEDRAILLSLYLGSDEHGRFDASPTVLCFKLAILDAEKIRESVQRLAEIGLVHLYTAAGALYGVIDGWDRDMVATHQKKRPASQYPPPPQEVAEIAGCSGVSRSSCAPSGHPVGTQRDPNGHPTDSYRQTDKQRGKTKQNKTRQTRGSSRSKKKGTTSATRRELIDAIKAEHEAIQEHTTTDEAPGQGDPTQQPGG